MKKHKARQDLSVPVTDIQVQAGAVAEPIDAEAASELCRRVGIATMSRFQAAKLARLGVNVRSEMVVAAANGAMLFNQNSLVAALAKLHKTLDKATDDEIPELARAIGYTGDKLTRAISVAAKDLGQRAAATDQSQGKKYRSFAPCAIVANNVQQNIYPAAPPPGAGGGAVAPGNAGDDGDERGS